MTPTCETNDIESGAADPMAHIEPHALVPTVAALDDLHPPLLQLVPLFPHERHERTHVLQPKSGGGYASLAFVDVALRGQHTAADEAGDEPAGLPWFFVDGGVFEDVGEGDGVEG